MVFCLHENEEVIFWFECWKLNNQAESNSLSQSLTTLMPRQQNCPCLHSAHWTGPIYFLCATNIPSRNCFSIVRIYSLIRLRDHSFKTSANFHDFEPHPLPSTFQQNPYEGNFWSLATSTSAHGDTPPPPRHADILNGWFPHLRFRNWNTFFIYIQIMYLFILWFLS